MTELRGYLTKDHERLLNYAVWCKYLAWIVLFVFAIGAVTGFIGQMTVFNMYGSSAAGQRSLTFVQLLGVNPSYAVSLIVNSARTLFQGFAYFLVLKGVSIGLSMIAETDVNYRDRKEGVK